MKPTYFGGTPERPFARRWRLIPKNKILNVELNRFYMTDPVKHLHNHPSFSFSIVLKGRYLEEEEDRIRERGPWSVRFRSPWSYHRINVLAGEQSLSLFIQGPEFWSWGFLKDGRKVSPEDYFRGR